MNTDECTCKMWLWYLCYRSQINSRNLKFPGEDIYKKKKAIPNSSAFPNDQTDNFLNLWFVFITSEFWLFSRLIWVNFSTKTTSPADPILLTLCPSHKIGMCTLLFCATLSISFSLMLGFWTSNHFTFGTWQTSQSTLSELSRHFFPSLFVWFILWEI